MRREASNAETRLLIVAPLRIEARALRKGCDSAQVVTCGKGPQAAARASARLAALLADERARYGVASAARLPAIALAGFGGALAAGLTPGDIVVATEVQGVGAPILLPSAPAVASALRRRGLTVHLGPLLSVPHLARGAERIRLAEGQTPPAAMQPDREPGSGGTGEWPRSPAAAEGVAAGDPQRVIGSAPAQGGSASALAVDMEAAWLLSSELRHYAPHFAVVRAVLDTREAGFGIRSLLGSTRQAYRALTEAGPPLESWASALGPRTVLLGSPRSFCGGVKRAIDTTEKALSTGRGPVFVRKEIVHNKHVVHSFVGRGVAFVSEVDEVPEGNTVIFSAHGVSPAVRAEAKSRRLRVIDATCPLVDRVHKKARWLVARDYEVILIGKKGHDEVEGVVGEAPEHIHVVRNREDVAALEIPPGRKIAILTQTTLVPQQVALVVEALKERFPQMEAPARSDTCSASENRQEAVRRLAPLCDLLLVIGSPNSSNSRRLVEESERAGTRAVLMDDESDLELAWLEGVRTVGLTAGASAPESLVDRMIAFLGSLGPLEVREVAAPVVERQISQFSLWRGRTWESR